MIAVLGCGPAGLMAAHAAALAGEDFRIFSIKEPSPMSGAQYLHEPIPDISSALPTGVVSYAKVGTDRGYAAKVYGNPELPTSWGIFPVGDYPAWSLHQTYRKLMDLYWSQVHYRVIEAEDIEPLCTSYRLVLSTMPADRLCYKQTEHLFAGQEVSIADVGMTSVNNLIIYNGRETDGWYRTSNLFGHTFTEWSGHRPAPVGVGVKTGIKPTRTDCDCHCEHDNFYRLGRFGRWQKGVLTSDAFKTAQRQIDRHLDPV